MATAPPTIAFLTSTLDSLTVEITPPNDPAHAHVLIYAYDYFTNAQVHASASIVALSYTIPGLEVGRVYVVTAVAVDTGGENSIPAAQLVIGTTNDFGDFGAIPRPQVVITEVVQESRQKVRIEYRLEDNKEIYGELTKALYSYNGSFSDAIEMKEAYGDSRHQGRFGLQFQKTGLISDPHHIFIWDISEIPDFDVHTYTIRFQGKSAANYSLDTDETVDLNTTPLVNVPVPAVVTGQSFAFTIPLFSGLTPVTGAVVTVDEIRNDADSDVLGGSVVAAALVGSPGVYQVSIALGYPAGRYRVFYSAIAANYSISERRELLIVSNDYQAVAELAHPALCMVYGKLIDNMGRPLAAVEVKAYYKREPSRYDRVGLPPIIVTTDEYGFFALHLLRGTEVQLHITELGYDALLAVPDGYTADYRTIQFNQPSVLNRGPYGHVLPIDLQ